MCCLEVELVILNQKRFKCGEGIQDNHMTKLDNICLPKLS